MTLYSPQTSPSTYRIHFSGVKFHVIMIHSNDQCGGGNGNPLQYSCLEESHGQGSLVGYSPWGRKESDMTELLSTQGIEPGSILASLTVDQTREVISIVLAKIMKPLCLGIYFLNINFYMSCCIDPSATGSVNYCTNSALFCRKVIR